MVEYAIVAEDYNLLNKIKDYSIKNFLMDKNCPKINFKGVQNMFINCCMRTQVHMRALGGPILKKCFQNFPPDPYITLYICKTENPGV